jgi:hypothetical protein
MGGVLQLPNACRSEKIPLLHQGDLPCPDLAQKIFLLSRRANQWFDSARLTRQEGRLAIVTKRAVGCGGRESCD